MSANENKEVMDLLQKAKSDLAADMESRDDAVIIWDLSRADFHYIPEISLPVKEGEDPKTVRITGIYNYKGTLYLIEEDKTDLVLSDYYNEEEEEPPVYIIMSGSVAAQEIGDPSGKPGYTTAGDLEEWLVVADCYFEIERE